MVAGTIPLESKQADKVRNTSLVFNQLGEIVARYDKIHLFGVKQGAEEYQESNTIEPGSTPVSFEIKTNGDIWKFGVSVCYDLRFPELYRQIGVVDCHILSASYRDWETSLGGFAKSQSNRKPMLCTSKRSRWLPV